MNKLTMYLLIQLFVLSPFVIALEPAEVRLVQREIKVVNSETTLGENGPVVTMPLTGAHKFGRLVIANRVFLLPGPENYPILLDCDELVFRPGGRLETSVHLGIKAKQLKGLAYLDTRKEASLLPREAYEPQKAKVTPQKPTGRQGETVAIFVEKYEPGAGLKVYVNGADGKEGNSGSHGGKGENGADGGKGGQGGFPRGAGGKGGPGGVGGDGGIGADGCDGGKGGKGGVVIFNVLPGQKAPGTLYCSIVGGQGGKSGTAGNGGSPGLGGKMGAKGEMATVQASNHESLSKRRVSRARSGVEGQNGRNGVSGLAGERGEVRQIVRKLRGSSIKAVVSH